MTSISGIHTVRVQMVMHRCVYPHRYFRRGDRILSSFEYNRVNIRVQVKLNNLLDGKPASLR